jgi:ADP-heptose:LPS heptosyltransferase
MEILLLHPGGLGDIILALPAIAVLRERFPAARLTIAANLDHVAPIMGGYVESALSLSSIPLHHLYSEAALSPSDIRFWKSFDRVYSWTGAGDPGFVRKMKEIHPHTYVASWRPRPQEPRHVSQIFVDSLGPEIAAGIEAAPQRILLEPELSDQGSRWLSEHNWNGIDPLITLHPGAGSRAKRWPIAQFISLGQRLLQERSKLLIIEGPAESGLAAQLTRELPSGAAIQAESLPLDLLSAVMARSSLFVGNDSGIAHLAAALGIFSTVIFGPTLPRHWAPLGERVKVLRDDRGCLESITVDDIIRNSRFEIEKNAPRL